MNSFKFGLYLSSLGIYISIISFELIFLYFTELLLQNKIVSNNIKEFYFKRIFNLFNNNNRN